MGKLADYLKKIVFPAGMTPLPVKTLIATICPLVCAAMTLTMVYSFLPKLVKSFGASEVSAGKDAGMVATLFMVGRFCFCFLWGYASDKVGRKYVSILSASLLSLSTLGFGFSFNLAWAACFRLLQGCSMGVFILMKACLGEMCDDTNSSFVMALAMSSYSLGMILGPSVGGILSFPGELYPTVFNKDSVFTHYGILLPNLLLSLGFVTSIILLWFFMPNTINKKNQQNGEAIPLLQKNQPNVNYKSTENKAKQFFRKMEKDSAVVKVLREKQCVLAILAFGFNAAMGVGFEELFPLFAATSEAYGGYSFTTFDIGTTQLVVVGTLVIPEMLIFPKVIQYVGPKKAVIFVCVFNAFLLPVLPALSYARNMKLFWPILMLTLFAIRSVLDVTIVGFNVLVNNSAANGLGGTVNALGMMCATLFRAGIPYCFGSLYSWSLSNENITKAKGHPLGFPFNHFFVFFILALFSLLLGIYTTFLPSSLEKQRTVEKTEQVVSNEDIETATNIT